MPDMRPNLLHSVRSVCKKRLDVEKYALLTKDCCYFLVLKFQNATMYYFCKLRKLLELISCINTECDTKLIYKVQGTSIILVQSINNQKRNSVTCFLDYRTKSVQM